MRCADGPISRFVNACCPMAHRLLVVQYSTSPLGAQTNIAMNMTGMNIIIFCCIGSAVDGVIRCCTNCVTPISTGVM